MIDKLYWFVPPIVPRAVRKLLGMRRSEDRPLPVEPPQIEIPRWCSVTGGSLTGRSLFLNPEAKAYQSAMLDGTFDQFLFDYIDRTDWCGKVIYDVGGHIGYHTLNFAHRVGDSGRVFAFEPHPSHLERMGMNLKRNPDLEARITLLPLAASNRHGRLKFFCTESIEGGGSSASFAEGSSTPFPKSYYADYNAIEVETAKLDDLVTSGKCPPPDLLKIDVEGAEGLVIEGALETIKKYRPRMVMEVHSLPNMLRVTTLLLPLRYTFTLLEDEDRRCFIAIEPPPLR